MDNLFKWIQSAVGHSKDPNQVRECQSEAYATIPVMRREECIMLYGPIPYKATKHSRSMSQGADGEPDKIFEIVVHSGRNISSCISLCRLYEESSAIEKFQIFDGVIPSLLDVKPDLYSTSNLQKIADCVRDHDDWSLAHIMVHLDQTDQLKHPKIQPLVNTADRKGLTPLMIAVNMGSKHVTAGTLAAGASVAGVDLETGDNVFHLAAKTSGALLDILLADTQLESEDLINLLNACNKEGKTPLHLACVADKPDVVVGLLKAGASLDTVGDKNKEYPIHSAITNNSTLCLKEILVRYPNQLYTKDMKNGGSPLHWASEKEILIALIKAGCDVHARDFEGRTPLHTMLKHKRLSCAVALLAFGARVEDEDPEGNSAIHIAAGSGNVSCLQAVLVFGADFKAKNKAGETAWEIILKKYQAKTLSFSNTEREKRLMLHTLHCVGAKGPAELIPQRSEEQKEFSWKPPTEGGKDPICPRSRFLLDEFLDKIALNIENRKGGLKILSLDGGGIRGLILCQILSYFKQLAGGKAITDMFDWIGGTSTGGILALALATGKTPTQCLGIYFQLKDEVFVGTRPYNVQKFEEFLKIHLPEDLTMACLPAKPRIAITATLADRHPAELHIFRNYEGPCDILGVVQTHPPGLMPLKKPEQQEVWRAARCSGAAPSYFRAAGRFVDGGLVSNNPTMDILTEVYERNCALKAVGREAEVESISSVLSIGTGDPAVEKVETVDLFIPESILTMPQLYSGMNALGRLLVDQACCASYRIVDRARAWCGMSNIAYMRLNPLLHEDIKMDETNDEVLVNMLWLTQVYLYEHRRDMEKLVQVLTES